MRRLGLIGGSSWISTIEYYRHINQIANERLGGMEFARLTLDSINFGELIRYNESADHEGIDRMLIACARRLKAADAEGIVICANTLHLHANAVAQAVGLPVIHIAEATSAAIVKQGIRKVALLGTKWTMEQDVYRSILAAANVEPIIPSAEDREFIHASIYAELGRGVFKPETKARYLAIIDELMAEGAQGVILGCTEIPLLLSPENFSIPSFDTTRIHAAAAVDFYLGS